MSVARQTRREPPELVVPSCPAALSYLLGWFGRLARRRTNNGFGANPITYAELHAWAALSGVHPSPAEIDVLCRLDDAVLAAMKPPPDSHG